MSRYNPAGDLVTPSGGSQQWSIPNAGFFNVGTTALNVNEVRYVPMTVTYPITLTAWQFEVTSTPATNANVALGIYAVDANWQPTGGPLYDSGSIAVANGFTGVKTTSGLSVLLPAGVYLVGMNTDTAMTVRSFISITPMMASALGTTPMIQRVFATQTFGAYPTPGTLWTGTNTTAGGLQNFAVFQWTQ